MMHRRSFLTGIIAAPIVEKFGLLPNLKSSGKIYISTTTAAHESEFAKLKWVEIGRVVDMPHFSDAVKDYNPYPSEQ